MKVDIIPIGNSKGVRIPKALLEQCGFTDSVDIAVEDDHLVLRPNHVARKGWDKAFQAMATKADDKMIYEHTATEFDESEWKW